MTKSRKYRAVNGFIFAGSFSIGVMNAGFDLEKVLEMTDDMPEKNGMFWIKNYPNIPMILPKKWENDEYLNSQGEVDFMAFNCPCSSLSRVNKHPSVDGPNNKHFYRVSNIIKHIKPKTFVIENAPTLIQLGFPILKNIINELAPWYRFTVIRDKAGNHSVAMDRTRTMVAGWRRDYFDTAFLVNQEKHKITVGELFADIMDDPTDDYTPFDIVHVRPLYKYSKPGKTLLTSICEWWIAGEKPDATPEEKAASAEISKVAATLPVNNWGRIIYRIKDKILKGKGYWDKSAKRPPLDGWFASMSEPQQYMHPTQDRHLNLREMGRIMTYPDSYSFADPENKCKCKNIRQAIAQGVPVKFGEWIAKQMKLGLDGKLERKIDADVVFQNNLNDTYFKWTLDQFNELTAIDHQKKGEKI